MADAILKEMLDNGVHFGHRVQKWNPKMKKYIYGRKRGIHLFDLEQTLECLNKVTAFVQKSVAEGKTILFVGTKPQALKLVAEAAQKTGMPYVVHKWIGGLLTNYDTVKKRIDYLAQLKNQRDTGEFDKYQKKEASDKGRQIEKLESTLGGLSNMSGTPDVLFVVDAVRDDIAIREANRLDIPVIAIADTNADPSRIKFVLPGNDDAIKSLGFFIDQVSDAILAGKKPKPNK